MSGELAAFDKAMQSVTQERGKDYGHPSDDFARAEDLKKVIRVCPNPLVRHALEMICVKMARLVGSPNHLDSVVDIAGYARCIAMILDRPEPGGITVLAKGQDPRTFQQS